MVEKRDNAAGAHRSSRDIRSFMLALSLSRFWTCSCRKPLSALTRLSLHASSCAPQRVAGNQTTPRLGGVKRRGASKFPLLTSIFSDFAASASSAMSISAQTSGHGTELPSCCRRYWAAKPLPEESKSGCP